MSDDNFNPVSRPKHYCDGRSIEPITVIESWGLPFALGCVVKYLARYQHKGEPLQDLLKAQWYLNHYIAELSGHHVEPLREMDEDDAE